MSITCCAEQVLRIETELTAAGVIIAISKRAQETGNVHPYVETLETTLSRFQKRHTPRWQLAVRILTQPYSG